jgi:4-hydroxy-tetrahydrodipicolinate reductase
MTGTTRRFPRTPSPDRPLRVAQVGLGEIGLACCRVAMEKRCVHLVGAADIAPGFIGKDLAAVLDTPQQAPLKIHGSIEELIGETHPDVILHTTGSRIAAIAPQLEVILSNGISCVTSAEELLVPDFRDPKTATRLDKVARKSDCALVGTGVNPGFVLDLLPLFVGGTCRRIDSLRAGRAVDLATRRPALRRKAGVGMTPAEFRGLAAAGKMGHVGLLESAVLICRAIGWDEAGLQESLMPILAEEELAVGDDRVTAGMVRGNNHVVRLEEDGHERLLLDLRMVLGDPDPADWVEIHGEPRLEMRIPSGVAGDVATAAILVHTAAVLGTAGPGLHTILDLPPLRYVP